MSQLQGPLEQHLKPAIDDAQIQNVAQGLKAARRAPRPRWGLRLAVAAAALALAVVAVRLSVKAPSERQLIELADGDALPNELEAGHSWALSDGSSVALEDGAVLQVVANQPAQLTLLLRSGRARFQVTPGGPRKWLVEAGLVSVEVVGTVFMVDRGSDGVRVSVERGTVIVRGDTLPDHLVRLDAGMSTLAKPEVAVAPPPVAEETAPAAPTPPTPGRPRPHTPSAEELLQLSDAARAEGNDGLAAQLLIRLLELAPDDANAPSAAFTLGRLELEKLSRPADAARHFALAAKSSALSADARLRQVEALTAAGDVAAAEGVARAAIERAADSPQAGRLRRWLEDPQHAPSWLR